MRHSLRCPLTGRFIPRSIVQHTQPEHRFDVVAGRLYGFKGMVVRARMPKPNGTWLVSFHKKLNGFVKPSELELVPQEKVTEYLAQVGIAT